MEARNSVYEPLALSNSDSGKEIVSSFRKKKKFRKKSNSLQFSSPVNDWRQQPPVVNKLWIGFVSVSVIWLVLLTWFALNLHFQSNILKGFLNEVAAGSQGVPDALQKCHSWSRLLQANQTLLFAHLASLSRHLENITSQIGVVQNGLTHVEEKLTSSPELINVPHEVQDLSSSVATFGSQIQDLQTSFNKLKEEQSNVLQIIDSIKINVTNINNTFNDFTKTYNASGNNKSDTSSDKVEIIIDGINNKINNINETMSHKLQWVLDDQHKDHMAIEALQDMSANITSRITTLQNDCSGKLASLETLSQKSNNISTLIQTHNDRIDEMQSKMGVMTEKFKFIEGNTTKSMADILELKNFVHLQRSIEGEHLNSSSGNPIMKPSKLFSTNDTHLPNHEDGLPLT